jgi:hypothetical protein
MIKSEYCHSIIFLMIAGFIEIIWKILRIFVLFSLSSSDLLSPYKIVIKTSRPVFLIGEILFNK